MENSISQESLNRVETVHPSPVLVAGPIVMAICLVAGGVVRGTLLPRHSTPALLLLALAYLFSRWFRRSSVVFAPEEIVLGGKTVRYDDIAAVRLEPGRRAGGRLSALNIYDRNGVRRLTINHRAYGTGLVRVLSCLKQRVAGAAFTDLESFSPKHHIFAMWVSVAVLSLLAIAEGFWGQAG